MLITELMCAHDYLAVQREAARILNQMIGMLDVRPLPDGSVKFGFRADVAFLDRVAIWGAMAEDVEGLRDDFEDGADADREHDGRDLPRDLAASHHGAGVGLDRATDGSGAIAA